VQRLSALAVHGVFLFNTQRFARATQFLSRLIVEEKAITPTKFRHGAFGHQTTTQVYYHYLDRITAASSAPALGQHRF
jgi:hypothetical protein